MTPSGDNHPTKAFLKQMMCNKCCSDLGINRYELISGFLPVTLFPSPSNRLSPFAFPLDDSPAL